MKDCSLLIYRRICEKLPPLDMKGVLPTPGQSSPVDGNGSDDPFPKTSLKWLECFHCSYFCKYFVEFHGSSPPEAFHGQVKVWYFTVLPDLNSSCLPGVPGVVCSEHGEEVLGGLVPHWAKCPAVTYLWLGWDIYEWMKWLADAKWIVCLCCLWNINISCCQKNHVCYIMESQMTKIGQPRP